MLGRSAAGSRPRGGAGTVTPVSTPDPADRLDASEVDPDAGSAAELPGYSAADRSTPDEPASTGSDAPGDPRQQPPVGPPAQAPTP